MIQSIHLEINFIIRYQLCRFFQRGKVQILLEILLGFRDDVLPFLLICWVFLGENLDPDDGLDCPWGQIVEFLVLLARRLPEIEHSLVEFSRCFLKRDYLFVIVDEDLEAVEGLSFLLGLSHTEEISHLLLACFHLNGDVTIRDEYLEISMTNFGADLFEELIHDGLGVKEVGVKLLTSDLVRDCDELSGFVASPHTLDMQHILVFKSIFTNLFRVFKRFTTLRIE